MIKMSNEDGKEDDSNLSKGKDLINGDTHNDFCFALGNSISKKIRVCENQEGSTSNGGSSYEVESSNEIKVIDFVNVVESNKDIDDYTYIPSLSDELIHQILARVPRSEYWKLFSINKWCSGLLRSGEIFKIRKELGTMEPSVFMLPHGEPRWYSLDPKSLSRRQQLPVLPSDICFGAGDRESFCAGTHLLVSGNEFEGLAIWRYELPMNKWFRGPSMINPRCLFASASCGDNAYVAGGIGSLNGTKETLNSAEVYNSETKSWEPLPKMKKRRKLCAGCYLDNKFYAIGGRDETEANLTCGECFDTEKYTWELIEDMIKDTPIQTSQSPPLLAVVNNELYLLEPTTNQLKVYLKRSNSWKELGEVPVRADRGRGWGVAFKSLGNELLVIGGIPGYGITICTCSPDPEVKGLNWSVRFIGNGRNRMSDFVLNCSVMIA